MSEVQGSSYPSTSLPLIASLNELVMARILPRGFAMNWKRTCFFAFTCVLAVPAFVSRVGSGASKKPAQITFSVTVTVSAQDRYDAVLKGAAVGPGFEEQHAQ